MKYLILFLSACAILVSCANLSGRSPSGYYGYYGMNYSGYSGNQPTFILPDGKLKTFKKHIQSCQWVVSIDNDYPTDTVVAYKVPGCDRSNNFRSDRVCAGTVKCKFGKGNNTADIYFDNVMCLSAGVVRNRCLAAKDCLFKGGVLESNGFGDVVKGNSVHLPLKERVSQ